MGRRGDADYPGHLEGLLGLDTRFFSQGVGLPLRVYVVIPMPFLERGPGARSVRDKDAI